MTAPTIPELLEQAFAGSCWPDEETYRRSLDARAALLLQVELQGRAAAPAAVRAARLAASGGATCAACGFPSGAHAGTRCPVDPLSSEPCKVCGRVHDGVCISDSCWAALSRDQKERIVGRITVAPGHSAPPGLHSSCRLAVGARDALVDHHLPSEAP